MIGWIFMGVGAIGGILTLMYTRKPGEDGVEVVQPDIMYTTDGAVEGEPHAHVHRENHVDETRPHLHRETTETRHLYRDGPA
ncbi:hypothetical protein MBA17_04800 [Streptosporangium sp. KLBMP 9127]|nr:hypothetical protein [Streptosporangium sp. KLBMP 9127]